jgi:hypothetical protein
MNIRTVSIYFPLYVTIHFLNLSLYSKGEASSIGLYLILHVT